MAPQGAGGMLFRRGAPSALRGAALLLAACLALSVLVGVIRYPLTNWPLAAGLAAYSLLLWHRPTSFLLAIPIVLPCLDLGIWTGWTMIEEPDLFIATTIAVLLVRSAPVPMDFTPRSGAGMALSGFAACWLIATIIGLFSPLGAPYSDNFLLRPDNAVRIVKGFVEALALLPFMRQRQRRHGDVATWLGWGLTASLVVTTLIVMAERALFTDLLDFSTAYRVVGPFSSMRVGGGHIGAYAALAVPFTLSLLQLRSRPLAVALAVLAGLCGAYTIAVTFARTAYAASAVAMTVAALGWMLAANQHRIRTVKVSVVPMLLVLSVLYVAAAYTGMSARFTTVAADFLVRQDNWKAGLAVRDRTIPATLFGMGLGSYQRAMLMRSVVNRPSDLVLTQGDQGVHVSIRSETQLFFGQKISLPDAGPLHLTLWARAGDDNTALGIALCDKVLLYSDNCQDTNVALHQPGQWTRIQTTIATDGLGRQVLSGLLRRPVELSLFGSVGHTIDVRTISLVDDAGQHRLANGDFTHALDHWVFTDDGHIAWRMKNEYLMLFFEAGLVGLAAYTTLAGLAFAGSIRALKDGIAMGAPVAGAIAGFMISGLFDNVLEAPRLAILFFLICWCGLIQWEPALRAEPVSA